jgi:LAO/AO transport system kinase
MNETTPLSPQIDSVLLSKVLAGDFRSIARLITLVENGAPEAPSYLQALFPHTGRSLTIGFTGAPGAGKSTLVDRVARHYRRLEKKTGIIAVDPTSPFTGGAILGDRIRMQSHFLDEGTFIRSMATRGNLGGLAAATNDVQMVLDAAGFDVILVETVGVGQDEVEIVRTADVTVLLLVPGMGDDIQIMKAGIMEAGDVLIINKSDHAGADRLEAELNALLTLHTRTDRCKPRIVRTVATVGQGIDECVAAITECREFLCRSDVQMQRRIQMQKNRLLDAVRSLILRRLIRDGAGAEARLESLARQIATREKDPYTAAEEILRQFGDCK